MILRRNPRLHVLVAAGLLGMGLYACALRLPHPAILADDFVQGVWLGACLGVEVLGVYLMGKRGRKRAA